MEQERTTIQASYKKSAEFQKEERRLIRECEEAFQLLLAGLEALLDYVQDEDDIHLTQGLELYKKGNKLLNKALFYIDDSLEELNITVDL